MIDLLRERFVNAWVLAKDLGRIASADPELRLLCRRIEENYRYPVDTVLLSPALELLGHRNVTDAVQEGAAAYRRLLREALGEPLEAEVPPAPPPLPLDPKRRLTLTVERPSGTLLDVLSSGRSIAPIRELFAIDFSAFEGAGTLAIELRVGASPASAAFELMRLHRSNGALTLVPVAPSLAAGPGETRRATLDFTSGEVLYLSATGAPGGSPPGTNAFLATISVASR